jgi:cation:H+ antiporter
MTHARVRDGGVSVTNLLVLVLGVATAALGGEFFVRGAVGIASWARVPARLVGTSVAAFATSTPELSVGIQSAAVGRPELALGDALGSNVVNVALVLGAVLLLGPMKASRRELRRELAFASAAPILTLLALADGHLVRAEAAVLLLVFAVWLLAVGREATQQRTAADAAADAAVDDVVGDVGGDSGWRAMSFAVFGLFALIVAGRLIVIAAKGIGEDLGLNPFVVGATLVALGTSSPELATAVISRRRGHADVGVGTVLGSNVFNNLWIVGIVALLHPVRTDASEVVLAVGACLVGLLLVFPNATGVIPRWRGGVLVALAATYTAATVVLGA